MSQDRKGRSTRIQIVRNGEAPLEITDGELELVVRHKWDHSFLLLVTLSMLCVGVLLGLVAAHTAAIERLEHDQRLALTWVQTHRHPAPGQQPEVPGEVQHIIVPVEEGESQ